LAILLFVKQAVKSKYVNKTWQVFLFILKFLECNLAMTANGLGIAEGLEIANQKFNLALLQAEAIFVV